MHLSCRPPIATEADLNVIDELSTMKTMPDKFMKLTKAYITVARHTIPLLAATGESTSSSLVRRRDADEELTALSLVRRIHSDLDLLDVYNMTDTREKKTCEFTFLLVRLHAYAQLLTRFELASSREEVLSEALAAAQRIISIGVATIAIPGVGFPANDDPVIPAWVKEPGAIPKNYTRGLAFAVIFLLRYTHPDVGAVSEEEGLGAEDLVKRLQELFVIISEAGKSEYRMLADVIDLVWQTGPGCAEGEVLVTHRPVKGGYFNRSETKTRVIECVGGDEEDAKIGDFLRALWENPSMKMLHMEHVMGIYSSSKMVRRTTASGASTSRMPSQSHCFRVDCPCQPHNRPPGSVWKN